MRRRPGHQAVRRQGQPLHRRPGPRPPRLGRSRSRRTAARHRLETSTGTPDSNCRPIEEGTLPSQLGAAWAAAGHQAGRAEDQGQVAGRRQPGRRRPTAAARSWRSPRTAGTRAGLRDHQLAAEPGEPGPRFVDAGAVPLHPGPLHRCRLTAPDPFFGGQSHHRRLRPGREEDPGRLQQPVRQRSRAARQGRAEQHRASLGKDPDQAWRDAVSKARSIAEAPGGELTDDRRPRADRRRPVGQPRTRPPPSRRTSSAPVTGRSTSRSRRSICCSPSSALFPVCFSL